MFRFKFVYEIIFFDPIFSPVNEYGVRVSHLSQLYFHTELYILTPTPTHVCAARVTDSF